jgi:prephenate dehydratase
MSGTVAYQGEPGAFGEEACRLFLPEHATRPYCSFEAVAAAVTDGEADLGMLPLENSCAGPVPGMADLLARSAVRIERRVTLAVRMHLLARPGTQLDAIRTVASHPMALAQCSAALNRLGVATEAASNTAAAAKALAASDATDRAVLASEHAAATYGLDILMRNLEDQPDNRTEFAIITVS